MGGKEHGLYVSSTPSSAARKAVTKLCTANKSKKVEFSIREITQGSKKKTYGPYSGYIEKLKEPVELKDRVIRYKPVAKLSGKTSKKMKGGSIVLEFHNPNYPENLILDNDFKNIQKELELIIKSNNNSKSKFTSEKNVTDKLIEKLQSLCFKYNVEYFTINNIRYDKIYYDNI